MTGLIVHSEMPRNAEPPLARLLAGFRTAQADFYVRSHGSVPLLTEDKHRLRVRGRVTRPLDLSMQALREGFSPHTVVAVMQCAGNRRTDLDRVRPVSGEPWSAGAIGNAAWTGVRLADVLQAAGTEADPALHVAFEACDPVKIDQADGTFRYGVSIPMSKALTADVLLAFAMNGEKLTPEHGFPLRVVVPGFAGVRSPKWLRGITVQDAPSDNPMQQFNYKLFPPDVTAETVDWSNGVTINEMPLNAAICEPTAGAAVAAGPVSVRGYAICTKRGIERVDLSADGGATWCQALLERHPEAPWGWTLWRTTIDLPAGEHELAVRAWDSAGQTQPAAALDAWNFKGYLSAAWHRVAIRVL